MRATARCAPCFGISINTYTNPQLTVNFSIVGAAVKEDADGGRSTIVDLVVVDLQVVAALGADDSCGGGVGGREDKKEGEIQTNRKAEEGR